jgi:soluble lytic murein transglycosylase-like protein
MADTARRHRDWAGLDAAHDLASVGLYDLAGPLVGDLWELARRGRLRGSASDRDLSWRALLFAARDHHHVARTTFGLWEFDRDAAAVDQAWQLGWPVAHERAVWRAARTADVDPWLVLGLMRQESTYDPTARSPVGARGAMQVMPRTGWLLADQRDDRRFTPADLDDPSVAVAYGVDYLGRLLDRFDGVWPVAVAAYNAGPTRVAQWLGPTRLPIDLWVELIPVRETRDYVRKVGAGYARYAALYAVDGVSVPDATGRDLGPDVVDF